MDEPPAVAVEEKAPPARRRRRRWLSRLAKAAVGLLILLAVLAGGTAVLLDTSAGHRFLADRIAGLAPHSGLRIRVGRIEGSVWGRTRFRDVRLYDPKGLFAESPLIELRWQPLGWITNRLIIHDLDADRALLHRLPRLVPSETPGPVASNEAPSSGSPRQESGSSPWDVHRCSGRSTPSSLRSARNVHNS